MKVSGNNFYREVTGKGIPGVQTAINTFTRWGVKFDVIPTKAAGSSKKYLKIDVDQLPIARAAWEREQAEKPKTASSLISLTAIHDKLDQLSSSVAAILHFLHEKEARILTVKRERVYPAKTQPPKRAKKA